MDDASLAELAAKLTEALKAVHACRLRRDGSDPGYGWNITQLNRAMDAALPLLGIDPPKLDPRTAAMSESAERIARTMGGTFCLLTPPQPEGDLCP